MFTKPGIYSVNIKQKIIYKMLQIRSLFNRR